MRRYLRVIDVIAASHWDRVGKAHSATSWHSWPNYRNGCPRRDPRQNSACFNSLREGKQFDEKIAVGPPAKALFVRERFGSVDGSSQGPFVGRAIERGRARSCAEIARREGITPARVS